MSNANPIALDSLEATFAAFWSPLTAERRAEREAQRLLEMAEREARRKRIGRLRRAQEASKTASHAAKARRAVIVEHLRKMTKAASPAKLSLGDMARRLEVAEVLTPRGNRRWTAQQVKATLRHALKYQPKTLRVSYLPEGVAKTVKTPKVQIGSKTWVPRKIRAKPPGDGGYAKPSLRRRSKITKRPGV